MRGVNIDSSSPAFILLLLSINVCKACIVSSGTVSEVLAVARWVALVSGLMNCRVKMSFQTTSEDSTVGKCDIKG